MFDRSRDGNLFNWKAGQYSNSEYIFQIKYIYKKRLERTFCFDVINIKAQKGDT